MELNTAYSDSSNKQTSAKLGFFALALISIVSLLALGYFAAKLSSPVTTTRCENQPNRCAVPLPTETPPDIDEPSSPQIGSEVKVGDIYLNDTIYVLPDSSPQQVLIATVSRTGQGSRYTQSSHSSYFDGEKWIRNQSSSTNSFSNISNDKVTKSWEINTEQSKVMRQTVKGTITLDNTDYSFTTETLGNEIAIRSLPEYTKFFSVAKGTLKTGGGKTIPARILYSRIYSTDAKTVIVYDNDFSFTTHWFVFWGNDGSFYHLDQTDVRDKVSNYASHSIGFEISPNTALKRTFDLDINADNKDTPTAITYRFNSPVLKTISVNTSNTFHKYPTLKYTWDMGLANGTITTSSGEKINGIGIYEYINND